MPPKGRSRPAGGPEANGPDESPIVDLYRSFSGHKTDETGAAVNHNTISVWAGTLILCIVLVFGLYQVRDWVGGVQEELQQLTQDNKLLLEGLDELLVRTDEAERVARAESTAPAPSAEKTGPVEKAVTENLSTRYKIYYRTKEGEDLSQISQKFGVSEDQLRLWNALNPSESLIPGQVVVINKSTEPAKPVRVARASPSPKPAVTVAERENPAVQEPASTEDLSDSPAPTEQARDDTPAEGTDVRETDSLQGGAESVAAQDEQRTTESPGAGEPVGDAVEEPGGEVFHIVQADETLSEIGQQYGVSWQVLAEQNKISRPETIYEGQKIRIRTEPTQGAADSVGEITHTVREGENLYRIGLRYGIGWEEIARKNKILNETRLFEGQVLKIPTAKGGPEVPSGDS